jgi:hypothetical protein
MTTRRDSIRIAKAAGAGASLGAPARAQEGAGMAPPPGGFWQSPSLTDDTITIGNNAITTQTAGIEADIRLGATEKSATEVAPGIWRLSGRGLGHSIAIDAPEGWIIVDTGESTRTAAHMRAHLERAVGGPVRVAAILLTHWHHADGTAAWRDEGADLWGHEHLDRNRRSQTGVSIASGFYRARAVAQFGVLHPTEGPDAFPNMMGLTPEKLHGESSYQAPERLFADRQFETHTIAGETVEVGPNRSDISDSVGFYFPGRRLLISNFMAPGFIFNVYSLRGGRFRDPLTFIEDCRWMEARNAEVLLDVNASPVVGPDAVRDAIRRSSDQVQLIHDQTLRMRARGLDGRKASEAVYMPAHQRGHWESYGQVESHVRQVHNGTIGWFDTDVYDIAPLSLREETSRSVAMMGGAAAVRTAAGQPVSMDLVRAVLGTPSREALVDAPLDDVLALLRFLVDPRLAEATRLDFTLSVTGEDRLRAVSLRNGVVVLAIAEAPADAHADVSRDDLAELILGARSFAELSRALAPFETVLDRSGFAIPPASLGSAFDDPDERAHLDAEGGH